MSDISTPYVIISVPSTETYSSSLVADATSTSSTSSATVVGIVNSQDTTPVSVAASAATSGASSNSTAGAGVAAAGGSQTDPNEQLLFWFNIGLLCVLALFFLASLPRACARFSRGSEWFKGHLLWGDSKNTVPVSSRVATPMSFSRQVNRNRSQSKGFDLNRSRSRIERGGLKRHPTDATLTNYDDYESSQGHTTTYHATTYGHTTTYHADNNAATGFGVNNLPTLKYTSPSSFSTAGRSAPVHIPSFSALPVLSSIATLLDVPVAPGLSIGKLLLICAYTAAVIILSWVQEGNWLSEPVRAGWVATTQIPVVIALGTKGNIVGWLVGMGYERLNFLHRWVGIITFIGSNIHALGYFYSWAINEDFTEKFNRPFIIYGFISLVGVELIYITSLAFVRQRMYKLFLFSHIVGLAMFLVALCYHKANLTKYVLLGLFIYAFDHLVRLVKTRITTAYLTTVPSLGCTRIEFPTLNSGWKAGQHVRLRIISPSIVGPIGWSVPHPFTIANASQNPNGEGMVLLVKKAGGWTNGIYEAASRAGYYPSSSESGYATSRPVKVMVEGPYGGPGHMVFDSFTSLLLVGGGSGITFPLATAEEVLQSIKAGNSSVRFIELVWAVRERKAIVGLLPQFARLLEGVSRIPGVFLKISVYYSRASSNQSSGSNYSNPEKYGISDPKLNANDEEESTTAYIATFAPNMTVHSGRPKIEKILKGVVEATKYVDNDRGVAVGVCGPGGLGEDVRKVVRTVRGEGGVGIEVHEEIYGW